MNELKETNRQYNDRYGRTQGQKNKQAGRYLDEQFLEKKNRQTDKISVQTDTLQGLR